jgi:hypothetical protein
MKKKKNIKFRNHFYFSKQLSPIIKGLDFFFSINFKSIFKFIAKLFNFISKENKSKYNFVYDDKEENQPFATLQKVLECVDPKCGINVEIKYPQQKIVSISETILI